MNISFFCWTLVAGKLLLLSFDAAAFTIHHDLPTARVRPIHSAPPSIEDLGAPRVDDSQEERPGNPATVPMERRPFEQRTDGPRLARRLNHGFRYLYRHNAESVQNMTGWEYLGQFYSENVLLDMNSSFPPLLTLGVKTQLHPKVEFLKHTMRISNITDCNIPPAYFGARLERIIAPRHAFLMHHGLPHGESLLADGNKWTDFLVACRKTKRFCALCNQWKQPSEPTITAKQIEAFDVLFGRGLLAATRNELCQPNNTWPLEHVTVTSSQLIELLVRHGADVRALDNRGVSLLHWASGTGNVDAVRVLLPYMSGHVGQRTVRDGATPLHWAAAGANSREFGTGGHVDVCRYLLSACQNETSPFTAKELVNQLTLDGNSALMWAGWSGSLDTVKLMVRNRANASVRNRNGCSGAHWAASGGNLKCCEYLADVVGVNFYEPNYGGNTPLTHAVAFGRLDVVKWLRERAEEANADDDMIAASLAQDFCDWKESAGDVNRQRVLQLFQDDYWDVDPSHEDDDDDGGLDM